MLIRDVPNQGEGGIFKIAPRKTSYPRKISYIHLFRAPFLIRGLVRDPARCSFLLAKYTRRVRWKATDRLIAKWRRWRSSS